MTSLPSEPSSDLADGPDLHCCYRNGSDRMLILVCRDCHGFELQRLIFPFELLTFACPPAAEVWVFADEGGGVALREHCAALDLQIQGSQPIAEPGLDSSISGQPDALQDRYKASLSPEMGCQPGIQDHQLCQWLPGSAASA